MVRFRLFSRFGGGRLVRALGLLVIGAALLTSGSGAGATSLGGWGSTGRYSLPSSVSCDYGSTHIFRIRVRPPQVFARDLQANVTDYQLVGYIPSLVKLNPDGTRTPLASGVSQLDGASEATAAPFETYTFEGVRTFGPGTYAVVFDMYWRQHFNANKVEGVASELGDVYSLNQLRTDAAPLRVKLVTGGCPWERPF